MLLLTLIPIMGSGPVWDQRIQPIVNNCYNNWWINLIYLQTFFRVYNKVNIKVFDEIILKIFCYPKCATHTWYLATDMQYHWISLIVIIALHKNIKFGLIINLLIIIMFSVITSILIFIYDFPPGEVPTAMRYSCLSSINLIFISNLKSHDF